jgi:hypothetical protein
MILCIVDDASSNRRVLAHAEYCAVNGRRRVIFISSRCFIHILHRSVVPILRSHNINKDIYRAAHVLQVSSYWMSLIRSVRNTITSQIVVLHNLVRNPHHHAVAEQILRLTYCDGLPDEYLSRRRLRFMDHVLTSLPGDWTSSTIHYFCSGDCASPAACRAAAVDAICKIVVRLLFSRKVQIPSLSRWWKFCPTARRILLGLSCHALWQQACPLTRQGQDGGAVEGDANANADDFWGKLHSFRVRKTFEFFHQAPTVPVLLIIHIALAPTHRVMAWVMNRDAVLESFSKSTRRAFNGVLPAGEGDRVKPTRPEVVLEFVDPATSPIVHALGMCSDLLLDARRDVNWVAVWAFSRAGDNRTIEDIWNAVLPSAARLWGKLAQRSTDSEFEQLHLPRLTPRLLCVSCQSVVQDASNASRHCHTPFGPTGH